MRIEDCIVTVERRDGGGCFDMAIAFLRQFLWPITRLTLCFAVPSCFIIWYIQQDETDALAWAPPIFLAFQAVWSATLVAAIGPQVFGVPISVRRALRAVLRRSVLYLALTGFFRLFQWLLGLLIIPGLIASVLMESWGGHLAEVMFLENAPASRVTSRLSWLCGGGGYGRNLPRLLMLWLFGLAMTPAIILLLDFLMLIVTRNTVCIGPLLDAMRGLESDRTRKLTALFSDSPGFLLQVQISLWIVMPLLRIAWFMCYLDQRIRNECWDLDLKFKLEASRLENAA
ncbi:MAG: hypothetical protein KDA96_10675 [Planctomycetaceae bacterium]|nr:hypothetical protein [Planctomycetaceae bacterium]